MEVTLRVTESSLFVEDNDDVIDPISNELLQILQVVIYLFLCGPVSLVGIATNVVNIVIFSREGFQDSINISLMGLAVADLSCVLTMFVIILGFNPFLDHSKMTANLLDVLYLAVGWPHVFFNRISSFITAFISVERCLCVSVPLKVKNIITPLRTKMIIISIFIIIIPFILPLYFVNKLEWRYNELLNRTMLTLVYTEQRVVVETATFPIHSVSMPALSFLVVVVCTAILVVQLNKKTKWREATVAETINRKSGSVSAKEKKVAKMVIFLSAIFIICYLPSFFNFLIMACNPEFSYTGKFKNLYIVLWSLTVFLETVNSSVNIFVYFKMSTRYRQTFILTFRSCKNGDLTDG